VRTPALSPNAQRHLERARRNYALFGKLQAETEYPEWAAIVLFYTALKLIDAFLVQSGLTVPKDHAQRRTDVRSSLRPLWAAYRDLEHLSRGARYDLVRPSQFTLQRVHDREFRSLALFLQRRGGSLEADPAEGHG
jgi:hypothetical protein